MFSYFFIPDMQCQSFMAICLLKFANDVNQCDHLSAYLTSQKEPQNIDTPQCVVAMFVVKAYLIPLSILEKSKFLELNLSFLNCKWIICIEKIYRYINNINHFAEALLNGHWIGMELEKPLKRLTSFFVSGQA